MQYSEGFKKAVVKKLLDPETDWGLWQIPYSLLRWFRGGKIVRTTPEVWWRI